MKRLISVLIISIFTLCGTTKFTICAQEQIDFTPTTAQHGVAVSTDVLAIAMPVASLTYVLLKKDWVGLKQGAFTAVTTIGATYLLKYTIKKTRPDGSDTHSMPSMHTSAMFADAAFLTRRYGWKIGVPAFVLATYVGWGRTFAKKHDWWDVVVGAAIGTGSAFIYTRPFADKYKIKLAPIADGTNFGIAGSMTF